MKKKSLCFVIMDVGGFMQRYFSLEKEENFFTLSNDDTYHITKVMRYTKDTLVEVVYDEKVYITKIIELNPLVKVEIQEELDGSLELPLKVTICQSLVKEVKMDLILQKSVELGAYSFIPLKTKNSIIKLDKKDEEKKIVRWQRIVKEASEQSKRTIIPEVLNVMDIKDLANLDYDVKILCTVNELSRTFKNILQNHKNYGTMIIVVGPEGGFKKDEEEFLIESGYLTTSLGNFVLRTETASIALLSMINYEYMR